MDNITYLCIGAAYNSDNGLQQFPPFLENLIINHNLYAKIIIIDPELEEIPALIPYLTNNLNCKLCYNKQNKFKFQHNQNTIKVRIFRQAFDFNILDNGIDYMKNIIRKVLNHKTYYPKDTCLFFVHDFSGYGLDKINTILNTDYKNNDLYKQNVQIGLGTIKDFGCSPNLNSDTFQPIILSQNNIMKILNCNLLNSFEIAVVFCSDINDIIKKVMLQIIQHRLDTYITDVICDYRKIMLCIKNNKNYEINYESVLCGEPNIVIPGQSYDMIKNNVIRNLLHHIYNIVDFLNYYPNSSINIFNKLRVFCESDSDIYNTLTVFKECVMDMFNYITNIKLPHLSSFYAKCVDDDDVLSSLIKI